MFLSSSIHNLGQLFPVNDIYIYCPSIFYWDFYAKNTNMNLQRRIKYLCSINFHNKSPSTSATCPHSSVVHDTVDWNIFRSYVKIVRFVFPGSEFQKRDRLALVYKIFCFYSQISLVEYVLNIQR